MSAIIQTLSSEANNSNITAELLLATYTADAERLIIVQPRLSNLNAAAASIYFRLEHTTGADALLACQADVMAATKCVATQTIFGTRASAPVLLAAGEKLKVYAMSSNASDTQASYSIAIIDATAGADLVAAVAASILATPANKIATNASGQIPASNMVAPAPAMITAQQVRDAAALALGNGITPAVGSVDAQLAALPTTTPATQADVQAIPAATAALVLETPAYPIATNEAGAVTASNSPDINPQDIADALGLAPAGAAAAGSVNAVLAGLDAVKPAHAPSVDAEGVVTANATVDTDAIAAAVVEGLGDSVASPADVEALGQVLLGVNGPRAFTYIVTDSTTGAPLQGVRVWITQNADGTAPLFQNYTDANGRITCYLPAGTVYVWREKAGYSFTNPDTETVS